MTDSSIAYADQAEAPLVRARTVSKRASAQVSIAPLEATAPSRRNLGTTGRVECWYARVKRSLELVGAAFLMVLLAPFMLVGAVLVKLTSPGPAFYSQVRVGRNGRPFLIYKLRTMRDNCEAGSGPVWSTVGDSRVTPIGRFLRASHIDELPQLWNVLCGDMSLIGPRPERPEFTPVLEQAIAGYRDRLVIRPGVTGLAQVQLPPDTDLASVQRKLAYDLYYIEHMSPWLDVRVLIGTFAKLAGVPFWAAGRLLAFPRLEELTSRRAECVA